MSQQAVAMADEPTGTVAAGTVVAGTGLMSADEGADIVEAWEQALGGTKPRDEADGNPPSSAVFASFAMSAKNEHGVVPPDGCTASYIDFRCAVRQDVMPQPRVVNLEMEGKGDSEYSQVNEQQCRAQGSAADQ